MQGVNCGSGQKPYQSSDKIKWTNIDINPRWNPDIVGDWNSLSAFEDSSVDIVVAEQSVEHVGCGEANSFFKEANRILKHGGTLIISVPDLRALSQRWLTGQITDYIFSVNLYGAFMSHEADRHKWNTSYEGWCRFLNDAATWTRIRRLSADAIRSIPECLLSLDWWILVIGAVK